MGFYKEDYEIIESLLESGRLKKGFKVCEFGAQDLCEDRNGERILNANNRISPKGVYESYFIDAVEEYMGREGCWRYLPLKQGLPSVSLN